MPILTDCGMCNSKRLEEWLDLGFQPPSNAFLTREQLSQPEMTYPLKMVSCRNCGLAQLSYVVPGTEIFSENYPYSSDTTETGRKHFHGLAKAVVARFALTEGDLAIDIGSNTGSLVDGFRAAGTRFLGVEPVNKLAEIARQHGLPTVTGFFDLVTAREVLHDYGHAAVITGTNVFAHVDLLWEFVEAARILLDPTGMLVIEAPSLQVLIDQVYWDTLYAEHRRVISLTPTVQFFARHGLEVFDVELVNFHGGSLRIFVGYPSQHTVTERVGEYLREEKTRELHAMPTLLAFADRVRRNRLAITKLLVDLKQSGKRIVAISAPAKGMTFLNYCKFDTTILDFATEKSPLKIGTFCPGTHIPVVAEERLFEDKPDAGLVLAWNFFEPEIRRNLKAFEDGGGKFILALPGPRVVGA